MLNELNTRFTNVITSIVAALTTLAMLAGLGGLTIMAIKFLIAQIRGI